ncbi:MAG: hypothetical protein COA42_06645 [Alteromonadaceae bacterium]|nr:MAG: hypothetical protein COA42_06645 [Alteromonadaceae bacterium]
MVTSDFKALQLSSIDCPVALAIAKCLGIELITGVLAHKFVGDALVFSDNGVLFRVTEGKNHFEIKVDFCSGAHKHRRLYGGGKSQSIAKAIGIQRHFRPLVLDCTAGLGADAFVLASLGCQITMLERSPLAACLLRDGLARARKSFIPSPLSDNDDNSDLIATINRMKLIECDGISYLNNSSQPDPAHLAPGQIDVIYLDPMFPERKKSALVKKGMRVFQKYIGSDTDSGALLDLALSQAKYRVVVKRPKLAPNLADKKPTYTLTGKTSRFDIYTLKAVPAN